MLLHCSWICQISLIVLQQVTVVAVEGWTPVAVTQPTLDWQPRAGWVSVTSAFCGAKGDGKVDDTAAIQKCLANMTSGSVLHFPPGTYRITSTLEVGCVASPIPQKGQCGIIAGQFFGHGAATILEWDGPANGTMLWSHGVTMSRYIGFHFDCRGKANTAIKHQSDTLYETENLHEVHRFSNCRGAAVSVDPVERVATAEMLFHNCLFESSGVGIEFGSFNDYDNTVDGCLFRNNGIGITGRAGNSYVRNTRFENSSTYDYSPGNIFWLFSSIHRCVSVGSDKFIVGGSGVSVADCHVDSWFGGEPNPRNKSDWTPAHFGPNFNMFGAAISLHGQAQIHDCTFKNPRCLGHIGNKHAQCCGIDGGQKNLMPFINSNNKVLTPGVNLTDHHKDLAASYNWSGFSSIVHNYNLSDPTNPLYAPALCPATGITSETNFYKSTWKIPGKILEIADFMPPVNKTKPAAPTAEQETVAVQACIDAAATAGNGAMCNFPKGTYRLASTIEISGKDFYIGGCGYQTIFQWVGPVVNATPGAPPNATAESLAVMWKVIGGTQVTIETLQLFPTRAGDDVVRLLIEGSIDTQHIGSPLEQQAVAGTAAAACTDVTLHGLELDAYNENMRSFTSGVRAVGLAKCDIVDVISIDGDIHAVGNAGTILVGFHTAGLVKIEPAPAAAVSIDDIVDGREDDDDASMAVISTGVDGFFGEMMRFTCCTHDFTTKIVGPQTYAVGAFYQESGNMEFHLTDNTPNREGLVGSLDEPTASPASNAARGRISISGIKHFTMVAEPHSLIESWNGDALFTSGLFSTQTRDCPGKAQGGDPTNKCNMTVIINGSGATNLAYVGTQPWDYPISVQVSGKHTLTQYGNVWTNASGVYPEGLEPGVGLTGPSIKSAIPNKIIPGVSANILRDGYDLQRRLGRLDLARHYPELGITDTCAGKTNTKPLKADDQDTTINVKADDLFDFRGAVVAHEDNIMQTTPFGRLPYLDATQLQSISTIKTNSGNIPVLNHIARSDWISVKDHGAIGDGKHDDTASIQAAIHAMASGDQGPGNGGRPTTCYFPPGTYMIKRTLLLGDRPVSNTSTKTGMFGGNFVGHGSDSTILWGGPAAPNDILASPPGNYSMLWDTGAAYFNFKGLVWDGNGAAAVGVDHFGHGFYATFMLHRLESYVNFKVAGIRVGGEYSNPGLEHMATAEIRFDRLHFAKNFYGVLLQSFNDLDNMFHGCHFQDNQVSVSTTHGNFYISDTRFERSNITDTFNGGCCAGSSIRRSVSVNSSMFAVIGGWCGVGQPAKIHDCRVEGFGGGGGVTVAKDMGLASIPAVAMAWRGPLSVVDTTFNPAAAHSAAPAVRSWTAETSMSFLNKSGAGFRQAGQYKEHDWARTYLLSNNKLKGTGEMLDPLPPDTSYRISTLPKSLGPSPITADTQFLPARWPISAKVFEARRDFGAVGDGKSPDLTAVQNCIDAAAAHGSGASCYLGPGVYAVNASVVLHGKDYIFEGAGSATVLAATILAGHRDPLVTINPANAWNITIQQMWLNHQTHAPKLFMGPPTRGASPRLLFADYIMCSDNTTGVVLRNLGQNDTVLIGGLYNPLSVIGSAAAVVLVNFHEGGYTTVAEKGANYGKQDPKSFGNETVEPGVDTAANALDQAVGPPDSTGFMGELVKVPATGVAFALYVRDSGNYVVGDFYEESNIQIVYISGTSADKTPGQVTMSNVKHHTSAGQSSPINDPVYVVIDSYHGVFAHTGTAWMQADPLRDLPITIQQVGVPNPNGPLQMLIFGDSFADCVPVFNLQSPANSLFLLGNNIVSLSRGPCNGNNVTAQVAKYCGVSDPLSSAVDDCMLKDTGSSSKADTIGASSFDHLRLLGLWDLYLNFQMTVNFF